MQEAEMDELVPRRRYGIRWMRTWPHASLGVSAHFDRKYGHLSIHLPVGVVIIGFTGDDWREGLPLP